MAAKSKPQATEAPQPANLDAVASPQNGDEQSFADVLDGIAVMDDEMNRPGGHHELHGALAVNPNASALDIAIGVSARIARLDTVIQNMAESTVFDEDAMLALHCYTQEIEALAAAVVTRLSKEARHG